MTTTEAALLPAVESLTAVSIRLLVNEPVAVVFSEMSIVRSLFGGTPRKVHCRVVVPLQMASADTELTVVKDGNGISTVMSREVAAPLLTVMRGNCSEVPFTAVTLVCATDNRISDMPSVNIGTAR